MSVRDGTLLRRDAHFMKCFNPAWDIAFNKEIDMGGWRVEGMIPLLANKARDRISVIYIGYRISDYRFNRYNRYTSNKPGSYLGLKWSYLVLFGIKCF